MPLKFVTGNENVFQLLGDFRPPDPLPCGVLKFPLKIPCNWEVNRNVARRRCLQWGTLQYNNVRSVVNLTRGGEMEKYNQRVLFSLVGVVVVNFIARYVTRSLATAGSLSIAWAAIQIDRRRLYLSLRVYVCVWLCDDIYTCIYYENVHKVHINTSK